MLLIILMIECASIGDKHMQLAHVPRTATYNLNPEEALNDLRMSEHVRPLYENVRRFIRETVDPMAVEFARLGAGRRDPWTFAPGQLDVLEKAKARAKEVGLWNFFLPDDETGQGLTNLDYAYIAVELAKNSLASETMNCSAPDTGNMEVLERVGTPEQKDRWLRPLLNGEIRSAYAMTEPHVASSDAKNISTTARLDGDEWVIDGEKYYISGAGDPRCKILIVMARTDPQAPRSRQHSQILVPMDTPGVEIIGPMHLFGDDHAPYGHMHLRFTNVRVPKTNILLGEGRGFEIAQLRLSRPHPSLHAYHWQGGEGARPHGVAGTQPRGLRQEDRASRRQPADHCAGTLRDRGDAADGFEGRQSDGRARQPTGAHLGQHGQGNGARAHLQDHRPSHPNARRNRHFPMDTVG